MGDKVALCAICGSGVEEGVNPTPKGVVLKIHFFVKILKFKAPNALQL